MKPELSKRRSVGIAKGFSEAIVKDSASRNERYEESNNTPTIKIRVSWKIDEVKTEQNKQRNTKKEISEMEDRSY